jgi:hypothetical protein
MITTDRAYIAQIEKMIRDKPSFLYISTFNWKVDKKLLNKMKGIKDVRIIVGIPDNTTKAKLAFFKELSREYKNIRIVLKNGYHTKFVVSSNSAIIGGRNLTGSLWDDLSFIVKNKKTLRELKEYSLRKTK